MERQASVPRELSRTLEAEEDPRHRWEGWRTDWPPLTDSQPGWSLRPPPHLGSEPEKRNFMNPFINNKQHVWTFCGFWDICKIVNTTGANVRLKQLKNGNFSGLLWNFPATPAYIFIILTCCALWSIFFQIRPNLLKSVESVLHSRKNKFCCAKCTPDRDMAE